MALGQAVSSVDLSMFRLELLVIFAGETCSMRTRIAVQHTRCLISHVWLQATNIPACPQDEVELGGCLFLCRGSHYRPSLHKYIGSGDTCQVQVWSDARLQHFLRWRDRALVMVIIAGAS